jgi:hypothetical protein
MLDKGHHALVPLLEDPHISVAAVDRPGTDHHGVGPGRSPVQARNQQPIGGRSHRRHAPVRSLRIREIGEPLREEPRHVHVERRRADEDLCITRPAEAFVALRTVGRHVDEVAPLAPDNVLLESVEPLVGAGELPRDR